MNTHDSRVVKTVRSLKNDQSRRPESAASSSSKNNSNSNQILKLSTNVLPNHIPRQDTTKILLKSTKDINQNDSQLYNENIYSPIKKPITMTASNSSKENQQNQTKSFSQASTNNKSSVNNQRAAPISNAKSLPRTHTSQQRDVNIRKSKAHYTPGKQALQTNQQTQKPQKPIEPTQQLTKQLEDHLIETSRDKVYECIRNSNTIHDLLDQANIDKQEIIELLYQNKLFKYQLAKLMFQMKVIVKKKVEDYVVGKIQEIIRERQIDQKLMEKFTNVQRKMHERMIKLQQLAQQYG